MKCCQGAAHCLLIFIATQCGHEVGCKTMREKEKRNQEGTELMGRSNHRETIRLDISSSVSELTPACTSLSCFALLHQALYYSAPDIDVLITCLLFSWTFYIPPFWKCLLVPFTFCLVRIKLCFEKRQYSLKTGSLHALSADIALNSF